MKKFSEIELWKDVSPEEWKNWKWQLSHCINTLEELEKTITISDAEAYGIKEATKNAYFTTYCINDGKWKS